MFFILLICLICCFIVLFYKRKEYFNNNKDKLIVYTYGTDIKKMRNLIKSCKKNNIKLVTDGIGSKWTGFMDKLKGFRKFLKTLKQNDVVMSVDGYDVIISNSNDIILETFKKFNTKILVSGEKGLWPNKDLKIKNAYNNINNNINSEFKYVNAGTYMGYRDNLLVWLDYIEKDGYKNYLGDKTSDDQALLTNYYLKNYKKKIGNDHLIKLDFNQDIFVCLYDTDVSKFDIINQNKIKKIYNKYFNKVSSVYHGNGPGMTQWKILCKKYC